MDVPAPSSTQTVTTASGAPTMLNPAAWHPDPYRRYEYRYWDGRVWTDDVASGGVHGKEPAAAPTVPLPVPQPLHPLQTFQPPPARGRADQLPWNLIVAGSIAGLVWPVLDAVAGHFQESYWFIGLNAPTSFDRMLTSGTLSGSSYWYVSLVGLAYFMLMAAVLVLSLRRSPAGAAVALAGAASSVALLCLWLYQRDQQFGTLLFVYLGRYLVVGTLLGAGGLMLAINGPSPRQQPPQAW